MDQEALQEQAQQSDRRRQSLPQEHLKELEKAASRVQEKEPATPLQLDPASQKRLPSQSGQRRNNQLVS
jgi:hypothetical protein